MNRPLAFVPQGVIPATLLPFHADLSIDVEATRRHVRDVAEVAGISAVAVNGHASEVHSCTFDEQRQILELSVDEIGDRLPVVAGIYADGSQEAARLARMATEAGASALLVFPPQTLAMGGDLRPEMALAHFKRIADSSDLPIIAFVYAERSGLRYRLDTLLALFEAVPTIRAIKDWCDDPTDHETHIRVSQSLPRPVAVLTTHSAWLLASLAMGCAGVLSGAGSVVADLQLAMFRAIQRGDLVSAAAINDRYRVLSSAFYAPPFVDMHNRMKECLVILGRLGQAVVRPPLVKVPEIEIHRLRRALETAGIQKDGAIDLPTATQRLPARRQTKRETRRLRK